MSKLFPFSLARVCYQQVRFAPRWSHRRPVQVYPPGYDKENHVHEHEEKVEIQEPHTEILEREEPKKPKKKKKFAPMTISSKKQPIVTDMLETILDAEGNFVYTKMKNQDLRVGNLLTKLKSNKQKFNPDCILLEGKRIIKDALVSGCKLEYLIFSRKNELEFIKPFLPKIGAKLYKMPYKEMQLWSDLTTAPGIMGVFKTPAVTEYIDPNALPLTVVCDNVRDPNNLGPILRTCSGVGCEKLILTKGCVNLWDDKVLRGSAGAHFKLQIHHRLEWNDIRSLIGQNVNLFIADNKKEPLESFPLLPYYGVNFKTEQHKVIIVGGETEGISEECYNLLSELQGARINVPLNNTIDSLNSSMALGIILFEIKRQLKVEK